MARRAERGEDRGPRLRWGAIGVALGALGATALVGRKKAPVTAAADPTILDGRGSHVGPVNAPSLEAGYEVEDTNVRALAEVMVVSVVIGVVSLVGVFWMFARFNAYYQDVRIGMTREQRAAIEPPLPHLQAAPYSDIDTVIMEQKQRIETYGWDDAAHTRAHIPIVSAMRQVVGKSLDAGASADAPGAPASNAAMPALPAYGAAQPQDKPGNAVPGEGRPGAIAPSYDPTKATETKP